MGRPKLRSMTALRSLSSSLRKRTTRRSTPQRKRRTSAVASKGEIQQASSYAATGFARDMLAIKDHLERALAAVNDELRADKVASQFLAGIKSTAREINSVSTGMA